jgi:hypothetical protein
VTGESGRERVRALGKVVILPVSAQHGGWTVRSTRAGETAGFQASQTWHWSEDTYEGANDGRCAQIYGLTLGGLGRSSARVEFPSNYTGRGLNCAHRRPRGRKRDGPRHRLVPDRRAIWGDRGAPADGWGAASDGSGSGRPAEPRALGRCKAVRAKPEQSEQCRGLLPDADWVPRTHRILWQTRPLALRAAGPRYHMPPFTVTSVPG